MIYSAILFVVALAMYVIFGSFEELRHAVFLGFAAVLGLAVLEYLEAQRLANELEELDVHDPYAPIHRTCDLSVTKE